MKTPLKNSRPQFVAIVGGSGAGKSWLADRLQKALGENVARLSLDDFYQDRSHLPQKRRAKINFDHPRAINWKSVEKVLHDCSKGNKTRSPRYDFTNHCGRTSQSFDPKPLIIVDGLWLLRRPSLRRFFDYRVFIECPSRLRLQRRLARDLNERGRNQKSVREQFLKTVAPMHDRFVATQARWANLVLTHPPRRQQLNQLTNQVRNLLTIQ
ncbi:MAG: zeta toxin family protein [Verrucomicrobiota bacterium]|nr:zeta toxin family protein [Verrucomicrobiota bacterium]